MNDLRTRLQSLLAADYALERELGGGGMSRVFVATEKKLGRRVVIKILSPELAATLSTSRFQREIQLAASLQQANIVPVLAAGEADGMPWYTMPYVEGESLRARLARGPLAEREALSVLRDVARALVYAHERSVVHRDIKPDNVLLSGESAVVTDFGIAKAITAARTQAGPAATGITQVGTSLGTPAYMAPEQAAGDPATDHRADIYAFGCMAFELLTGRPPFVETAPHKLLAAHLGQAAPRLSSLVEHVSPAVDALVAACLEKQPGDRPQTARDLLAQLDSAVSGSGIGVAHPALRRQPSLSKALAIWAAAFAATWILARAAVVGIGLPDWTVPLALVVAGLGLPAVVATWYVQNAARKALLTTPTITPGGTQVHGTMATMALKVSPHLSWHRTWKAGGWSAAVLAVAIAAVMVLRFFGVGPAASLLAAGRIAANSRVLVVPFTATTADTSLGSVVAQAMRASLSQSKAVQLVTPAEVATALQRMKLPSATPITDSVARQMAAREDIPLLVTGQVASAGGGFLVTVSLVRSDSNLVLATIQKGANGAADLIEAVGNVAKELRSRVGESLRTLARAPALERATTSSLPALRYYSEAVEAGDMRGRPDSGMVLLKLALKEDSTFAQAWRKLAAYESNAGGTASEIAAAIDQAYRFRDRLPDDERAEVEAYYVRELSTHGGGEYYRAHPELNQNNRAISLTTQGRNAEAEAVLRAQMAADSAAGRPIIVQVYTNLLAAVTLQGKLDAARRDLAAMHKAFPNASSTQLAELWVATLVSDDSMRAVIASQVKSASKQIRTGAERTVATMAISQGELRRGAQLARTAAALEDSGKINYDPVGNAASEVVAAAVMREAPEVGVRALDSIATTIDRRGSWLDRGDLQLASAYAQLGRADRAKALLAEFERGASRTDKLRRWGDWMGARGEVALAEGQTAQAISDFRQATYADSGNVEAEWTVRTPLRLARAFDKAGTPDSAITYFERVRSPAVRTGAYFYAPLAMPVATRRLGELYEAKGDTAKAVAAYEEFVKLWKNADPDLQPQVTEIKARIQRLRAREAGKR
ncbi:MAG: protein kinase [Gemmatimonadota bacterium]|nr:protein kinase [Gemmatimonadota bacterium]